MPKIIPNIPKKFERKFPKDYQNTFPYWGFFPRKEIEKNKGKLLMMDIDFGRYCSLNCSGCFRKSNIVDDIKKGDLTYDELIKVIDEAKDLGLQNLKICGAGESTQHTRFLDFIREMTKKNIGVMVFTKGQVLGSDKETRRFYSSRYGINFAQELCNELYKLKVSFALNFQSFYTEIQDKLVGKKGHTLIRNQALENLINVDFNNSNPTRLSLCNAPITKTNYDEVFDIYVYARERNIYPVNAVLMISGKQIDSDFLREFDITRQQKIDLWTKIYSWNIEHGIQTLEQIKKQGISVMPGIHPCNQVACGLYLTAKGNVVGCPGFTFIEGNVRTESIKDIWQKSENKRLRAGKFNCKCPPKDGITIPNNLYSSVLKNLEKKYS